jgi:hypothetical protein
MQSLKTTAGEEEEVKTGESERPTHDARVLYSVSIPIQYFMRAIPGYAQMRILHGATQTSACLGGPASSRHEENGHNAAQPQLSLSTLMMAHHLDDSDELRG